MKKINELQHDKSTDDIDKPTVEQLQAALAALAQFEEITNIIYNEYKENETIRNRQI